MIHLIMKSYKNYPNAYCGNSGFMPDKTENPVEATCKQCIKAYEADIAHQKEYFKDK